MIPTRSQADPVAVDRDTWIVSAVVLLGAVMSILDATVVNVALDRLSTDFDTSLTTIQWVVSGYTLALATVIPAAGWASDRFGDKQVYIGALAAFTLGSALCAIAWNPASLIAFRVLQGLGGGMVLPLVTTIVTKKAGPERRGRVMGILGIPLLAAPVLGPILGGWLVDDVSWRAIFLINLPIGAIAILLARLVLAPGTPQPAHRLDWLGLGLLSPGLALVILGFAESPAHGFGSPLSLLPILLGGFLISAFFAHSWRAEEPLIDVKTFVRTRAGPAAVTLLFLSTSLFGVMLMMPVYFQLARGFSALDSGLLIAPQGVGAMITMPIAGVLVDRRGPYWLAIASLPLLIVGMLPFVFITDSTSIALLSAFNLLLGAGMGLSFMPTITSAIQAVPEAAIGRTSTAMNAIDQCGASIGTALLSVVLATSVAASIPHVTGGGLELVEHLGHARRAALAGQLAEAFATTFACILAIFFVAIVPAALLARRRRPRWEMEGLPAEM
jgi:EmrB/QacA subfamily drug resistance transporter